MLQLLPGGSGRVIKLGNEIKTGMHLQVAVSSGMWQGSRLIRGGEYALLGATVAPGFEFTDLEIGHRDELLQFYPQFQDLIVDNERLAQEIEGHIIVLLKSAERNCVL